MICEVREDTTHNTRNLFIKTDAMVDANQPPPTNSPAGAFSSQFQTSKAAAAPKECGYCGTNTESLTRCAACKSIHYCSKECQRSDWPVHKPKCLEVQGKPVPDKVRQRANRIIEVRQKKVPDREKRAREFHKEGLEEAYASFKSEPVTLVESYGHNCYGKRRRVDFPSERYAVGLQKKIFEEMEMTFEEEISLGMFPEGISSDDYCGRGIQSSDPVTGAKMLILHERLYANRGDGGAIGSSLDGIFVINRVVNQTAVWNRVKEPRNTAGDFNRYQRFEAYLSHARNVAKAVPSDVELGIHNP
jgi:SET and MYND domain-containing protein